MRIVVEGEEGTLANNPESALQGIADAAQADGADRDEWLEKALRSVGVRSREVHVSEEPQFQIVRDKASDIEVLYRHTMTLMGSAIRERLETAAVEAARAFDVGRRTESEKDKHSKSD